MLNRDNLEKKLQTLINQISLRVDIGKQLKKELFTKHNVDIGSTQALLNNPDLLSELPIEELLWYTEALIKTIQNTSYANLISGITIDNYFTEIERISFGNKKKKFDKSESIYPIVIENILQISEEQWATVMDLNKLQSMYQNQVIYYNRNTQRPATVKNTGGIQSYSITVKEKSVTEIKDLMQNNLFIPNTISLNLNLDNPELKYEILNNKIIIHEGGLDIVDGYHRFKGALRAKKEKPDFNINFIINIMNFDEEKASMFIAQEDKKNKMDRNASKSMDTSNPINLLLKKLNEDSNSVFLDKIKKNPIDEIDYYKFFNILDLSFKIKNRNEVKDIVKLIKSVTNYLEEETSDKNIFNDIKSLFFIIRYISLNSENSIDNIVSYLINYLPEFNQIADKTFKKNTLNKNSLRIIDEFIEKHK